MKLFARIAGAASVLLAAACTHAPAAHAAAQAAAASPAAATPAAQRPCTPSHPAPTMLYPMNGAKDVPPGPFTLVLAYSFGTSLELTTAESTTPLPGVKVNAPVPSPLPSPAATPEPGYTRYGYAIPALAPHTTYTVAAHFMPVDPGCTAASVTIGTFTTR